MPTSTVIQPLPAPTFTQVPTSTPAPPATAERQPRIQLNVASDFGDTRNPLTGELVSDPTLLERRPIAVKVSNAPPGWVRPQSGLSAADHVFEHVTEGPITRFTAILYGTAPEKIGSIRSARLIDIHLLAMYDAALSFSGSSIGLSRKLFSSAAGLRDRILRTNVDGYYRSDEDKPYEHRLYAEPERLWQVLEEREENRRPLLNDGPTFDSQAPNGGDAIEKVTIRYEDFTEVVWRYDADSGHFARWVDGEPHVDANTGRQITAANVVVLFAEHEQDLSVCELQQGNQCLAYGTDARLLGEGEAILMRDGLRFDAEWRRQSEETMLTLWTIGGTRLPFQLGKTWFQLIPTDFELPVSFTP